MLPSRCEHDGQCRDISERTLSLPVELRLKSSNELDWRENPPRVNVTCDQIERHAGSRNSVPSDEHTAQLITSQCMHYLKPYNLMRNMVSTSVCVGASFGLLMSLIDEAEMVTERPNVTHCCVFYFVVLFLLIKI